MNLPKDPTIPTNTEHEWYVFTLSCGHDVASKIRLRYRKPGREHHIIHCPTCERKKTVAMPTAWRTITEIINVPDVPSRTPPLLPNRILRLDYPGSGGELPYTTSKRDY